MKKIFKENLKKELKREIKGNIYVHIVNDMLIVTIYTSDFIAWQYTLCNITLNISTGLSSEMVADIIIKKYKKYILTQYFLKR